MANVQGTGPTQGGGSVDASQIQQTQDEQRQNDLTAQAMQAMQLQFLQQAIEDMKNSGDSTIKTQDTNSTGNGTQ